MLKKIKIKNFRSLENFEIEIKPLMLLFGQNSSGKSTFLKALMFLKENLYPLNTDKTKYFINEINDLISYKDIVYNNDTNRNIVFEFYFSGCYDFPDIKYLDDEFYNFETFKNDLVSENNYNKKTQICDSSLNDSLNLIKQNLHNNNYLNIVEYIEDIFNADGLSSTKYYDESYLNFCYRIEFRHNENEQNLFKIEVEDLDNKYLICFVNDNTKLIINKFRFFENKNKNLKLENLFSAGLNFFKYPEQITLKDLTNFNITLNNNEYYEISKFIYLTYTFLPYLVTGFLSIKHLPTIREMPRKTYNFSNDTSNPDYFGLIQGLYEEQIKLDKLIQNYYKSDISFNNLQELVSLSYKLINNTISADEKKLLTKISEHYDISKNEDSIILKNPINNNNNLIDSFVKNSIIQINIQLLKCDINDLFFINYNNENKTAKLEILNSDNTRTNLIGASSGQIQILPIICFYHIYKANYYSWDNYILEDNIQYLHKYLILRDRLNKPVLVEANTLFIEQPELHLHPKLQCKIAKLFTELVLDKDVYFTTIIETHSEHIIKSIQVDIANGKFRVDLSNVPVFKNLGLFSSRMDLIGVYYFDKINGKSCVKEMEIQDDGFFKEPWPNGFFDDSYNLGMELLFSSKN